MLIANNEAKSRPVSLQIIFCRSGADQSKRHRFWLMNGSDLKFLMQNLIHSFLHSIQAINLCKNAVVLMDLQQICRLDLQRSQFGQNQRQSFFFSFSWPMEIYIHKKQKLHNKWFMTIGQLINKKIQILSFSSYNKSWPSQNRSERREFFSKRLCDDEIKPKRI